MPLITTGIGLQNSSATCLRQVKGQDGELITQASVATLSYEVWDISDPQSPINRINETSLTVGNHIFDTPLVDGRWTQDTIGYNFALILPISALPNPVDHRVDVKMSFASGDPDIIIPFNIQVNPTYHDGP